MSYDRNRGRSEEPPLPKPYDFVPLPEGRISKAAPTGHHIYKHDALTGTLTATIIARSPVHVASGLLEPTRDRQYPLMKAHFRTNGTPAIPGTSLKGCIRSIVEAITPSSVQVTRERGLPSEYQPSRQIDQLDIAQRIFGAMGYQGMVNFGDAILQQNRTEIVPSLQLFRTHPESLDTYFDGNRPRGRKFYMHGKLAKGNLPLETCPVDSRFTLHMDFENLQPGELGIVLIALGLSETRLWPKLGGAKPACLGTVEVITPDIQLFQGVAAYKDFESVAQTQDIIELLEAAQSLLLEDQLKKLADILRWPREERNCPDRNY